MADHVDKDRGLTFYDRFYRTGGWKYSNWREYRWHRRHFVKRFGLRRGMNLLEVACGNGFHTNLLAGMGFRATGADISPEGINWAKQHYSKPTYVCCDMREMPFDAHWFDVVYARGCSHYHYDLSSSIALESTELLMRHLKPGGVFVMVIVTDLSGRKDPDSIWHNKLEDYRRHFSSFSGSWSVEWIDGMAVCGIRTQVAPESAPVQSALDTAPAPTCRSFS